MEMEMSKFKVELFELMAGEEVEVDSKSDIDPEAIWPSLTQLDDWGLEFIVRIREIEEEEIVEEETDDRLFTALAGSLKIGQHIRTKVPFSGVPVGTTGTVFRFHQGLLSIRWNLGKHGKRPLQDWFSRWEYDKYLEEIGGITS